ncbi:DsbC family protein [Porticoccaceae bacterium LTM1]|nr:DsbC family protein [Porticoccaceae bacterium LTM1]
MTNWITRLLLAAFMFVSLPLMADVDKGTKEQIVHGLKKWRPDLSFTNIMETPIDGLYHVQVVGGPSLYTSADGKYFISGDLQEVGFGRTENWRDKVYAPLRRELIQAANPDNMITYKPKGEAKAVIYVFTDLDCGYCVKLQREIPALNDMGVEVRYLAFPRAGMGSASEKKLTAVWCADDPVEAMGRMMNRQEIARKPCQTKAIEEHMKLVREMGINATPAIILGDGTLVSGYRRASQLKQILGI